MWACGHRFIIIIIITYIFSCLRFTRILQRNFRCGRSNFGSNIRMARSENETIKIETLTNTSKLPALAAPGPCPIRSTIIVIYISDLCASLVSRMKFLFKCTHCFGTMFLEGCPSTYLNRNSNNNNNSRWAYSFPSAKWHDNWTLQNVSKTEWLQKHYLCCNE